MSINQGLTRRQRLFCEEYLKDFNAKQACLRAGYSDTTARTKGTRELKNPKVLQYLNKIAEEEIERLKIQRFQTVQTMLDMVNVDIREIFDEDGRLIKIKNMKK